MKPGDHPEFFRFPAPEGRSRESTIVLDAQGRFWHDQALVEKESMNRAFSTWIRKHPDNGRFILENGYDWTYFCVEDVPFFIRTVTLETDVSAKETQVRLTLSDESTELLDPASLCEGEAGALYCHVKHGQFEARFMPFAQTALSPLVVEDSAGRPAIRIGGEVWSLRGRV